jgi:hypothetical protein
MAFPTGWVRKVEIVLQGTEIDGTYSDFPVGSNSALNGGGDIRFSTDSAGTTQIACEIVSYVTNASEPSREAEIWVLVPSITVSTDESIWMWYSKAGETQPATGAAFGRDAVWVDYTVVAHLKETANTDAGGYENATGGTDGTGTNMDSALITAPFGPDVAYFVDEDNDEIVFPFTEIPLANHDMYIGAWLYVDDLTVDQRAFSLESGKAGTSGYPGIMPWMDAGGTGDGWSYLFRRWTGPSSNEQDLGGTFDDTDANVDTWQKVSMSAYDTALESYLDGVNKDSDTWSGGDITDTGREIDQLAAGRFPNTALTSTGFWYQGGMTELRFRNDAIIDANWESTEYNNQNNPGTFAIEGTAESANCIAWFGFGTGPYGRDNYGSSVVSVLPGGEEATTAVGTPTTIGDAIVTIANGVEGNTALGTALATITVTFEATGIVGTTTLGDESTISNNNLSITGEEALTTLGTVTTTADAIVTITGEAATTALGDETVTADAIVAITGEEATTTLGTTATETDQVISVTGFQAVANPGVYYMAMSSTAGNFEAGDLTVLDGKTTLGIAARVAKDEWGSSTNQILFRKHNSSPPSAQTIRLRLNLFDLLNVQVHDGTSLVEYSASSAIPSGGWTDGDYWWFAADWEADNGASASQVKFYYKQNWGDSWTQVGGTITKAVTAGLQDGTRPAEINLVDARTKKVLVGDTLADVDANTNILIDCDPVRDSNGSEPFTSSTTGETWTATGTALVGSESGPWADVTADAIVTIAAGVEATSALGDETVTADAIVTITGEQATTALGNESVITDQVLSITGEQATTALGIESVTADANTTITGEEATTTLGTVSTITHNNLTITGEAANTALGVATTETDQVLSIPGEEATTALGAVTTETDQVISITGEAATTALGEEVVAAGADVVVSGVSASALLGSETLSTDQVLSITGVTATTALGDVHVWGDIDPDQEAGWVLIEPSQAAAWQDAA